MLYEFKLQKSKKWHNFQIYIFQWNQHNSSLLKLNINSCNYYFYSDCTFQKCLIHLETINSFINVFFIFMCFLLVKSQNCFKQCFTTLFYAFV